MEGYRVQPSQTSTPWSPSVPTPLPRMDTSERDHSARAVSKDVTSRRASRALGPCMHLGSAGWRLVWQLCTALADLLTCPHLVCTVLADRTAVWRRPGNATARRAASPHDLQALSITRAVVAPQQQALPACMSLSHHYLSQRIDTHRSGGRACRRRTRCSCTKRQRASMRGCCVSQKRSRALNTSCARRQAALGFIT